MFIHGKKTLEQMTSKKDICNALYVHKIQHCTSNLMGSSKASITYHQVELRQHDQQNVITLHRKKGKCLLIKKTKTRHYVIEENCVLNMAYLSQ